MNAIVPTGQTGTALTNYDERRAAAAERYAVQVREPPSGDILSIKGGLFTLGDDVLGDEIAVVILNNIWVNTYFAEKYVEGQSSAPTCYAYGRTEEEMFPHPSMMEHPEWFKPQAETCELCPFSKWESAETGKGKRCSNRERLALVPAGIYVPRKNSKDTDLQLFMEEDSRVKHFTDEPSLTVLVPPTSITNWNVYIQKLRVTMGQPPFGVITRMSLVKHPTKQYLLEFETIDLLPDDVFDVCDKRNIGLQTTMAQPYKPPREKEGAAPKVQGLVRGAR